MSKRDSVRYTMTHGEMLPSVMADATLSLTSVVYSLYGKQTPSVIQDLKDDPFVLPEQASLVIQYHQDDNRLITAPLLSLTEDRIREVRDAIARSDKNQRPVVSYSCTVKETGATARLVAVFNRANWECKQAINLSYPEANFIYETLVRLKLAH